MPTCHTLLLLLVTLRTLGCSQHITLTVISTWCSYAPGLAMWQNDMVVGVMAVVHTNHISSMASTSAVAQHPFDGPHQCTYTLYFDPTRLLQSILRWHDEELVSYAITEDTDLPTRKECAKFDINYIWINTYYMDKYSSSELCKAINFMCRWSNDAVLCYAYLDDVWMTLAFH